MAKERFDGDRMYRLHAGFESVSGVSGRVPSASFGVCLSRWRGISFAALNTVIAAATFSRKRSVLSAETVPSMWMFRVLLTSRSTPVSHGCCAAVSAVIRSSASLMRSRRTKSFASGEIWAQTVGGTKVSARVVMQLNVSRWVLPLNGNTPASITYSTIPRDHKSHDTPYRSPDNTSGAMYAGDPQQLLAGHVVARPKSATTTSVIDCSYCGWSAGSAFRFISRFSGLMSRWAMLCLWMYAIALIRLRYTPAARLSEKCSAAMMRSNSVLPSTKSRTKYKICGPSY
eukprot:gene9683-biopygen9698